MGNNLLGRIEEWRRKLLDLTNRNQLVSCKIGPRAAVRLEHPSPGPVWSGLLGGADLTFAWKRELVPDANESGDDSNAPPQLSLFGSKEEGPPPVEPRITLEQCLGSRALSPNHLLTDLQDRALGNRLNRMSLNARTALSEQGVNVLFVAFGFLKWFEAEHRDEPRLSPLLLVPVCLERIGATAPWKLSLYEDEITPNFCLQELMKRDFRLELPEADPQSLLDDEQARERYESAIREAVRNESGWEVLSDAVLGQFSFQKLAMYDDYGRHATEIAEHEHCRRIAGDDSTPPPFAVAIPSPAKFDAEVHPSKLHTILPCDASQLEAILAIKSGASLVLDGPPGTGKSQTIANVIAVYLGG